jgi:hypothetical protein
MELLLEYGAVGGAFHGSGRSVTEAVASHPVIGQRLLDSSADLAGGQEP